MRVDQMKLRAWLGNGLLLAGACLAAMDTQECYRRRAMRTRSDGPEGECTAPATVESCG